MEPHKIDFGSSNLPIHLTLQFVSLVPQASLLHSFLPTTGQKRTKTVQWTCSAYLRQQKVLRQL